MADTFAQSGTVPSRPFSLNSEGTPIEAVLCGTGTAYLVGLTLMLWNANERRWF